MESELVKMVSERTGLPAEQAKVAIDTVVDYLKDRLPAPIASQIDGLISSEGSQGGGQGPLGGLGGIFGGR